MKPRFSILTLLVATAYVAVALAGLRLESFWNQVHYVFTILILIGLGIEGSAARSARAAFAMGMLATALVLFATTTATVRISGDAATDFTWHLYGMVEENVTSQDSAFVHWLKQREAALSPTVVSTRLVRWLNCSGSLLTGVLGGYAALLRYRVLERRAKQAKPGG